MYRTLSEMLEERVLHINIQMDDTKFKIADKLKGLNSKR